MPNDDETVELAHAVRLRPEPDLPRHRASISASVAPKRLDRPETVSNGRGFRGLLFRGRRDGPPGGAGMLVGGGRRRQLRSAGEGALEGSNVALAAGGRLTGERGGVVVAVAAFGLAAHLSRSSGTKFGV
jgi:hypothetical protein